MLAWPSSTTRTPHYDPDDYHDDLEKLIKDHELFRSGALPGDSRKFSCRFQDRSENRPRFQFSPLPECYPAVGPEACIHVAISTYSGMAKDVEALHVMLGLNIERVISAERLPERRKIAEKLIAHCTTPHLVYRSGNDHGKLAGASSRNRR